MKALYALVGMKHLGTEAVVNGLKIGHPLLLIREPDNRFDPNAVQVFAGVHHIGYIKATQVRPLARKLDAPTWHQTSRNTGRPCIDGALRIDGGRWPMVEVDE